MGTLTSIMGKGNALDSVLTPPRGGNWSQLCIIGRSRHVGDATAFSKVPLKKNLIHQGGKAKHPGGWELGGRACINGVYAERRDSELGPNQWRRLRIEPGSRKLRGHG